MNNITLVLLLVIANIGVIYACHANCTCLVDITGPVETTCGNETTNIKATFTPNNGDLQIVCSANNNTSELFDHLVGMKTGPIKNIQIMNCPMPNTPLDNIIIEIMGGDYLKDTQNLVIQSYGKIDINNVQHFKHFTGLNRFELSSNQIKIIPENMLEGMKKLTLLYLRDNEIESLPEKLLYSTPDLKLIELGHNHISNIADTFFSQIKSLHSLNLWGNQLTAIDSKIFSNLQDLESLDISSNKIQNIHPDTLKSLTKLKDLNLSSNKFTTLPTGLFNSLQNLTRLRLQNIESENLILSSELFANLKQLQEIIISRANIFELPADLLSGTKLLQNFTISDTKLTTVPESLFSDNLNLTHIDFSANQISHLPDKTFLNLKKLKVLIMKRNKFNKIKNSLLESLSGLEELDLSENQIDNIERVAFQSVQNSLRILRLDYNNLTFANAHFDVFGIQSPFSICNNIEEIYISHNNLPEIPSDWRMNFFKLKLLNMSYNSIKRLTVHDIQFLKEDVIVDLQFNNISIIDLNLLDILAQAQLKRTNPPKIILSNNILDCTSCFNNLFFKFIDEPIDQDLFTLETSQMTCKDGKSIENISYKKYICSDPSLDNICPADCTCSVQNSRSALRLNCCTLPPSIKNIEKIRLNRTELISENCNINSAPAIRHYYRKITGIYLANNNLTELHYRTIQENLETIELHNNKLTVIKSRIIDLFEKNLTRLSHLTLSGNPWVCDCNAFRFISFVQKHYKMIDDLANVTCEDGRAFQSLITNELCPVSVAVAASLTLAVLGILLSVTAALYYKYQQQIKVWLYAHHMCLWFVTEEELDKDKKYDAFISYSHKDEGFVGEHLISGLEPPFKLCIHVRDWVAGDWIPEQIARSVNDSRRTLVVLSPSFIDSIWGRLEFRAAHQQALSENRVRVIVIILEDVGPLDKLDPELRTYLQMNTYLKWGEPWFWDKLRYALPHKPEISGNNIRGWGWGRRRVRDAPSALARKIDDKLELVRTNVVIAPPSPSSNTPPAAINGHTKIV